MKTIKVTRLYCDTQDLYTRTETKAQRALLGYMIKGGYSRDAIYGGAFKLLREIEKHAGIYCLETQEPAKITLKIVHIAESALLGMYDDFAFSEKEITNIQRQFGNFNVKEVQ